MPFKRNDETKNRILNAALECFLEKGFSGTTVVEIGKRANINKALIYYYFSGKEILFQKLIEEYLGQITQFIKEKNATSGEQQFFDVLEELKLKYRLFLKLLLKEIVSGNVLAIQSVTTYLDEKNIGLQNLLTLILSEKQKEQISSLHNRELSIAIIGISFADMIFEGILDPLLNVKNNQKTQFQKNYHNLIQKLLTG